MSDTIHRYAKFNAINSMFSTQDARKPQHMQQNVKNPLKSKQCMCVNFYQLPSPIQNELTKGLAHHKNHKERKSFQRSR